MNNDGTSTRTVLQRQSRPGRWGAIITDGGEREIAAPSLTRPTSAWTDAAIEGLNRHPRPPPRHVYTDSAYVMNCFEQRWYDKWERNGWLGAGKKR